MKIRPLLALCALTLLLPACKTMDNKTASAVSSEDGYDHAYMAQVERMAQSTGTEIIWVNPPQAKKTKTHD